MFDPSLVPSFLTVEVSYFNQTVENPSKSISKNTPLGPSINYVSRRGGRGLAKCLCYYISLCSKVAYGGGRGVKNWQNLAYVVYGWSLTLLEKIHEHVYLVPLFQKQANDTSFVALYLNIYSLTIPYPNYM